MQLFRDFGYITQQKFEEVDKKCSNQGPELPKECQDVLDEVADVLLR